jgi:hypothetical protein
MTEKTLVASMSGRPIEAKSPTTWASNEEVGTSVHCLHALATMTLAAAFVATPSVPRSV